MPRRCAYFELRHYPLLRMFLADQTSDLVASVIRTTMIGRRDRLAVSTAACIAEAEAATAGGRRLHLRIAFDYSSRDAILEAARRCRQDATRADFGALVAGDGAPDLDLVVRTGGEKRLSDFLLWESAYAELRFVERMWPDFDADDLREALRDLRMRVRRFGGLSASAA